MCCILLGLVVDLKLPNGTSPIPLIRAIRSLLDFLYLSQYPLHTSKTLQLLHESLQKFHENKHIFIELGIQNNFNLPKLHSLLHYVHSIKTFGTTDNYNTEYTECLHIDLAKDAYRATNHRDEYAQMTAWLQRKEKILRHESYLEWCRNPQSTIVLRSTDMTYNGTLTMTKSPSVRAVNFNDIISKYGATFFREALKRYTALKDRHTMMILQQTTTEDTRRLVDGVESARRYERTTKRTDSSLELSPVGFFSRSSSPHLLQGTLVDSLVNHHNSPNRFQTMSNAQPDFGAKALSR
ncbi:hypothetical protein BJ322DRAFT_1105021 [Thelephora terrestris]|uniref:Uncharacterized protein n=1 Tax=Thelephora terrestris TaxID=56493 RepID=A0A9P6HKN1_9AGAM|nr:hypothetical protein BJ322DRAFT_1105021 [Thelephora terrestris]